MSIVNGSDLFMWLDDELIGTSTSYTISIEDSPREITNKGSGFMRTYKNGLFDVTASCDGFVVYDGGVDLIYDAMMARTPVKLDFGEKLISTLTLDNTTRFYTGYFIVASFEESAKDADSTMYSATFKPTNDFARGVEEIDEWFWIATDGDDSTGDGSYTTPWKTLSYACTQVTTPGDVIHVKAGTYTETEQCIVAPGVSIVGAGLTSIIKLNYVSTGATDAAIMLTSSAGASINGNQSISYLLIDGDDLTCTRGIYVAYRNNVVIHNCTIRDISYHGVIYNGTTQSWTADPTNTSTGNRIHNCILDNIAGVTGPAVGTGGGVRIMGQSGFEFDHNQSIQDSRVSGENADNIKGYANKGMKVHDNYFKRRDVEAWWNFYSEFHYSWGGFEVYDNTFVGGGTWDASGNVKGSYDFGLKIYRNSFTTTTGAAVARGDHRQPSIDIESFTYSNDIYIFNNIFTCVDVPILIENSLLGINNIHVYYNLMIEIENLTDAYSSPIIIYNTIAGSVINDLYIYNNVMTGGSSAYAGVSVTVGEDINNLVVRNNIFQGPDMNYPARINAPTPTGYVDYFTFTNNISYGCGSNTPSISASVTVTNDNITDNITDDPLFVGGGNYHLQSGSPAIGAGVDVGLTEDYDGQAVNDPPEIGAYEY